MAMTEPRSLEFKVTPMQPVVLISLSPPEKDYLFLSILSSSFFILLAILALFSLKVGTVWLPPIPVVPKCASSLPPHSSLFLPRDLFVFLLENLLPPSLLPPQGPPHCSSSFFRWGTEPCPYLPHTTIPGLELPTFPWDALAYLPLPLETLPPACLHPHRPGKPTFMGIRGKHRSVPDWPWASASQAS